MLNDDNCVIFKGKKDGILVLLDSNAEFELLKGMMRKKVVHARKFFAGAKASITFKGRTLTEEEESELLDIIFQETNLHITFVHADAETKDGEAKIKPWTKQADALKIGSSVIDQDPAATPAGLECMTYFHHGAIRSGQFIRYAGSVIVLGDVNPGGEIIAEGSIIVLGALKGLVHAGCAGDLKAYISAQRLHPTQLRIADIITYIPTSKKADDAAGKEKDTKPWHRLWPHKEADEKQLPPSYAYIYEGQIFIAPLVNL